MPLKYRRLIKGTSIFVILLLDWAALDDITTGHEPNYYGEYLILFFSLLLFVYFFLQRG